MKHFGISSVLREADPDTAGGGNGASAQLDEKTIKGWINESVNGLGTRLETSSNKKFTEFGSKFDGISDLIKGLSTGKGGEGDGTGNGTKTGDGTGTQQTQQKQAQQGADEIPPALKAQLDQDRREREKLAKDLKAEQDKRAASEAKADKTEREAAIRRELSKYPFASEAEADTVFDVVAGKIQRGEDGEALVVGDTTLSGFMADYVAKRPGLLAPDRVNGSGAGPNGKGKNSIELDGISSNSTKEQKAAYLAEIQRVAGIGKR